jgi:hypothetical protein
MGDIVMHMIRAGRGMVSTLFLVLWLITISPAFACEAEGENVTVENSSSGVVVVFENDVPIELLHPAVTTKFHILRFSGGLTYSVQSFDDRAVLAERVFTWDEIVREDGIEIVIR